VAAFGYVSWLDLVAHAGTPSPGANGPSS
jgi:hypothetical protein